MISKLRNRFIRIATLSVAAVMLLLTAILNVANYAATDADLRSTLRLISDNRGTIPLPEKPGDVPRLDRQPPEQPRADGDTAPADDSRPGRNGPFTAETPYATRYFVLFYQEDGTLVRADLQNIASVTEADTAEYLAAAVDHGAGYGS